MFVLCTAVQCCVQSEPEYSQRPEHNKPVARSPHCSLLERASQASGLWPSVTSSEYSGTLLQDCLLSLYPWREIFWILKLLLIDNVAIIVQLPSLLTSFYIRSFPKIFSIVLQALSMDGETSL